MLLGHERRMSDLRQLSGLATAAAAAVAATAAAATTTLPTESTSLLTESSSAIKAPGGVSEPSSDSSDSCDNYYNLTAFDIALRELVAVIDAQDAYLITDANERIIYTSTAWENMCCWKLNEVYGKSNAVLQGKDTDRLVTAGMMKVSEWNVIM